MGMGSGKTRVTIDLITALGLKRVLVFCPKSVVAVWARQAKIFAPGLQVCELAEGTMDERRIRAEEFLRTDPTRPKLFVTNYQAAQGAFPPKLAPPKTPEEAEAQARRRPANLLAQWFLWRSAPPGWDLIVLDEIHMIKAPTGVTSRFMHKLAVRTPRRLGLTGTALPHSPLDAFGEYRFLDESIFGRFVTKFKSRYCEMDEYVRGRVKGWKNQEEFSTKLGWIMFQVRTEDVIRLPLAVDMERFISLGESRKNYVEMEQEFVTWINRPDGAVDEITAANVLVKLLRLQEITGGAIDKEVRWSEKRNALLESLEELPPGEPVVVFGRFHTDLDQIHRAASDLGRKSLELSGRLNQLSEWQNGDAPVLACQIQSGSLGVDMTRARYAVYYSLTFSMAEYEQSRARLRRPGQTGASVIYVHLICRGSIDEKIYAAQRARKDLVEWFLERARGENMEKTIS